MDADRSLSAALCPPSLSDQTHTRTGDIQGGFGRGWGDRSALAEGIIPSVPLEYRASVFDIVTMEGEGCSAARWEEMSRKTRRE